jgi:hypothetical protein
MEECTIKMFWDEDKWISEAVDEKFSLTLESGSLDALVERAKIAVQDIYEVDFNYTGAIRFNFVAERVDNLRAKVG